MFPKHSLSPTLVFDGECRVCSAFARLISWWARALNRDLRILPFQQKKTRDLLFDLTDEEIRSSAHLVLEDGEVLSGSHAFAALLDRLSAIGSVHHRLGHRSALGPLVRALYEVGLALRRATRCATTYGASTA